MNPGDEVVVEGLDRTMTRGEIVEIRDVTVGEYEPSWMPVDGASLWDYWRGWDVQPDETVVTVMLDGTPYDYPESKVEVMEDG